MKPSTPAELEELSPHAFDARSKGNNAFLFMVGVLLPIFSLVVELITRLSADVWIDPIPTPGHVSMVVAVIVSNAWSLQILRTDRVPPPRLLQLNRVALWVALLYALAYLPATPLGVFGLMIYGLGLATFGPLGALLVAFLDRHALTARCRTFPKVLPGLAMALCLFALFEAPALVTEAGVQLAGFGSRSERALGISLLRRFGSERHLLSAVNRTTIRQTGPLTCGLRMLLGTPHPWDVERIYHRVTGGDASLNLASVVRPPLIDMEMNFGNRFDPDQGSARIGRAIPGLAMARSELLGSIDADGAVAYYEWTMEFTNATSRDREARAIVQLPHGAAVSRLTLWVNGVPREASFASRAKTRAAYTSIFRRSQDPVLVTTAGRDRIMVQCFPVLRGGKAMKVRLGVTAPVLVNPTGEGRLRLPRLLAANFERHRITHKVQVASGRALEAMATPGAFGSWLAGSYRGSEALKALTAGGNGAAPSHELRGELSDAALATDAGLLKVARDPTVMEARCKDTLGGGNWDVARVLHFEAPPRPKALFVVIEASASLAPLQAALADFLSGLPADLPVSMVLADDVWTDATYHPNSEDKRPVIETPRAGIGSALAAQVRAATFEGGQDNQGALRDAVTAAGRHEGGAVLWLHGRLRLDARWGHNVKSWMDQATFAPRLWQLQLSDGPTPVLRKMDVLPQLESRLRTADPARDLAATLAELQGKPSFAAARFRRVAARPDASGKRTSEHLARLWAAAEIRSRLSEAQQKSSELERLAHSYQVVTPISGAVVLETDKQTKDAGLKPGDPGRVPSLPEPGSLALLALVGGIFGAGRRRSRSV